MYAQSIKIGKPNDGDVFESKETRGRKKDSQNARQTELPK